MVEGVDYELVASKDPADRRMHVKLLKVYPGIVFRYGAMKFEEKEDGMHLLFNYDVLGDKKEKKLERDMAFKNHIGDLLTQLLSKQFEQDVEIFEDENETGTDDIKGTDI